MKQSLLNTHALPLAGTPDAETPCAETRKPKDMKHFTYSQKAKGSIVVFLAILFSFGLSHSSFAQGPGTAWLYNRAITLSPATPNANYQVKVTLVAGQYTNMKADGSDLRFYNNSDVNCNYWIQTWNNAGTSTIWVKVPNTGATVLWMYYGNASATAASNGDNVFDFFDDFTSALGSKWTTSGTVTQSGSIVTLSNTNGTTAATLSNTNAFTPSTTSFLLETKHQEVGYNRNRFYATNVSNGGSPITLGDYGYFSDQSGAQTSAKIFWNGAFSSSTVVSNNTDYLTQWLITDGSTYTWNTYLYSTGALVTNGSKTTTYGSTIRYIAILVTEVANTSIKVDWVRVRQYTATEPVATVNNPSTSPATFGSTGTFVVPPGVNQLTVECWGGGGRGGTTNGDGKLGGGGGGAYSRSIVNVTAGNSYTVTVGAGSSSTAAGGDSWFSTNSTVMAKGGLSVADASVTGVSGGLSTAGVGDTKYSGGTGASGGSSYSGGGGSSAGTGANGNNGSTYTGGIAPTGGGAGGNGKNNAEGAGTNGVTPGGGGGGAYRTGFTNFAGGSGANGQVSITWVTCTNPTITTQPGNSVICAAASTSFTVAATGTSLTYQWQVDTDGAGAGGFTNLSNGGIYSNVTTATLNLTNVPSGNNGYWYRCVVSSLSCPTNSGNATLTVNTVPAQPGAITGSATPCLGSSQTYSVTNVAGVNYSWSLPTGWTGSSTTNSITVTVGSISGNIQVTPSNTCGGGTSQSLTVTVSPPSVGGTASSDQTICSGTSPANITLAGNTGTIQWQSSTDNITFTNITGATSSPLTSAQMGTITSARYYRAVVTSGPCSAANSSVVTVTVNPASTLVFTSGTQNPTVCLGTVLTSTVYTFGGSATDAAVTNLPNGLTSNVNTTAKTVTISGTPTVGGTYTITTSGHTAPCTAATISGTVTVNTPSSIVFTSGIQNPTVCAGTAITSTVYTFSGSVTNASVTNLPAGLSSNVNTTNKTVTISGTPTASGTYTITTSGHTAPCTAATITGAVTVNPVSTIVFTSGTQNAVVCAGTAMTSTVYTFSGSATNASVSNLPAGLSSNVNTTNKTVTITGTPTASGTYTITTSGQLAPCNPVTINGSITINPASTIIFTSGTQNPVVCAGTAIPTTVYTFGGSATNATVSNLPNGLTADVNTSGQTVTISGTPTASGTYTITTSGHTAPCTAATINGTVTINQPATIALTSGTQNPTLCYGTAIPTTVYTFGGSATNVSIANLPGGLTPTIDVPNKKVTISGTPTATGMYTITTIGQSAPCEAVTISGTVTVNTPSNIVLDSESDTQNQILCTGSAIKPVTYLFGGSATDAVVSNLPDGLTAEVNTGDHTVFIYGVPTTSKTYTITTSGETAPCMPAIISGSFTLETLPDAGPIAGSITPCEGSTQTYSVAYIPRVTYQWTLPSGWTGTSSTNSINVTVGSEPGEVQVRVLPANTCGYGVPGILTLTVRPLTAAAGTITGTTPVCKEQSGVAYSVPEIAYAEHYVWTVPSGASIVSGDDSRSITVDYSMAAVSGNITVHGTNAYSCGDGPSSSFPVIVNTMPVFTSQPSDQTVCESAGTAHFTVAAFDGSLTYQWQEDQGSGFADITNVGIYSGATLATLNITNPAVTMNGYTYRCIVSGNCPPAVTSNTATLNVTIAPTLAAAGVDQALCGTTATLAANTPTVGTGAWSIVSGTGGSFADATNPGTAFTGTAGTTYTLRWTISNAPCTPSTDEVVIYFKPKPVAAGTISGTTPICAGISGINYNVPTITGATSYVWAYSGTGATINGNGTSVTINFASNVTSGNLTVKGINECGEGTVSANYQIAVTGSPVSTTGVTICEGGSGSLTSSTSCPSGGSTSVGPNYAGTGTNTTGVGSIAWSNTGNISSNNNVYSTIVLANNTQISNYLKGTQYSFAIPINAIINGIQVTISRFSSNFFGNVRLRDNEVKLVKAGTIVGNNKGILGTDWPSSETVITYGTTSDLWGTSWTPADINNTTFGAVLSVLNATGVGQSYTGSVDYMQITVTYSIPGSINWYTASSGGTLLGSGTSFNPVGVTGSPLANTNTAGTYTFFAECSTNATGCRAATDFVINPLPAISSTGGNQTINYGDTKPALSATVTSGQTVDWYDAATGGTKVATGTTTTTTFTPTQTAAGVYTYYAQARNLTTGCVSATRTPVSLTINAIPITLTATGPTKVYGTALTAGTSIEFILTSGSYAVGQSATSVTLTPDAAGLSATTAAGQPYVITPSAATGTGGFLPGNYTITYVPYNGTVSLRPITLTATGPSKTYGTALSAGPGNQFSLTSGTYASGQSANSVTLTPDAAGLEATTAAGSSYVVTPSAATGTGGFSASNYDITYEPFNGTVNPKAITITATGPAKEYGTALTSETSTIHYTVSGEIVGEEITDVILTPDAAGLSAITPGLASYVVTPSDATGAGAFLANNYAFTYTAFHGIVSQKALTVTGATTHDKHYDGTTTAILTDGTLIGVINEDEVNLVQSGDFATKNVGTGIAITSNCSINGAGSGNYTLTQPLLTAANIKQKVLTISGTTIAPKIYDGHVASGTVTAGTLSGLAGTETLVVPATGVYSDPNVGTGKTATISYTLMDGSNGGLATNYTLENGTATGDITPKALTITGITANNKPYDGNTSATLSGAPAYFGLVDGESFTVTGTASALFETAAAGTGKTVIVTGYLSPGENYTVTQPNLTADITGIVLTITADNQTKCAGATFTFNGNEFTSAGLISPDVIASVSFTSGGAAPEAAEGTYDIVPSAATGTGLGNYTIHYLNGTMTLTPNHWTGTTSAEWSDASNWCAGVVPGSTANVVIPATSNNPVIGSTTAVDCNDLTIEPTASLTIHSDDTHSGSLIVHGVSTGKVTYKRWLNHSGTEYSRWYITSAPVQVTSGFDANADKIHRDANANNVFDFATYMESANDWNYVSDIPSGLVAGQGYLISLLPASDGIVQFTGTLNNENVSPIVSSHNNKGWNAVGNPYTSAIKVVGDLGSGSFIDVNKDNLNPDYAAIYVWNEDAAYSGNEQFYKVIGNSGYTPLDSPFGSLSDNNIQAGQGFLVHSNGTSTTVNFNKSMQVHQTDLTLKSAKVSWPGITLLAESHGQTRSTAVAFNDRMTAGLDVTYDAGLLASDVFQVYTHLVGGGNAVNFAIQCLPEQYNQLSVPVGVDLPDGGDLVFKASGNLLPQGLYPILEDRVLNKKTLLASETDSYPVTLAKNTTGIGRFYLSFGFMTSVQPIDQQTRKYTASFVNNRITIFGDVDPGTKALVYDISGRKVGEYPLENLNRNEIMVSGFSQRVYLLKIENKNFSQVIKLVSVYTNF